MVGSCGGGGVVGSCGGGGCVEREGGGGGVYVCEGVTSLNFPSRAAKCCA